jgi:AcrR family transcriptional regulator
MFELSTATMRSEGRFLQLLEEIIERIIDLIREDSREEDDTYPPMAHVVAKRVLREYNFTSRLMVARVWDEAAEYDSQRRVFRDVQRFICASLPDVLAEFVKNRMGSEYQHLFADRMAVIMAGSESGE